MGSHNSDDIFDEVFGENSTPATPSQSSRGFVKVSLNPDDDDWEEYRPAPPKKKKKWPKVALGLLLAIILLILLSSIIENIGDAPSVQDTPNTTLPSREDHQPTLVTPAEPTQPQATQPAAYSQWEVRYYGQKLRPDQQAVYQYLVEMLMRHEEKIPNIHINPSDDLSSITAAVRDDYPELFWFSGGYNSTYYTYDTYLDFTMTPNYVWDAQTSRQYQAFVEEETAPLIRQLASVSEYEKVKGVYDYLIDHTAYDSAYSGKTMYDLLYYDRAVCEAYARATQYLLIKLGIETIYVSGEAGDPGNMEGHAWNIVKVNGDYYELDTTWGDPVHEDGSQTKNYNYFCVTSAQMQRDHKAERTDLPVCTATACNYYVVINRLLTGYDESTLRRWFQESGDKRELELKAANKSTYDRVMAALQDGSMATILSDATGLNVGYHFSYSDDCYTVTIGW